MSELQKLINKYCPDGVEYKKLGSFVTISRGGNFQKKDFCEIGVPCIHYGQIYTKYGLFADKTFTFIDELTAKKQKFAAKNDIVMAVTSENIDDVCKCVAWIGEEKIAVSGHTAIIHHNQNAKYLTYYFHSGMFYEQKKKIAHGTKVIEVTPKSLDEIKVPVPPIEVQREIVRILDNFTDYINCLEKELELRKKQYVYYRDKLLDFGSVHGGETTDIEWRTLGEVSVKIFSGKNKEKNQNGIYPVYGSTGIIAYCEKYKYDKKQILIARVGANAGFVHIANGKYDVSDNTIILDLKDTVLFKYIYYLLVNMNLNKYAKGGGQPLITSGQIKEIKIPVPPIEEQERIVKILDRFDTLCNDLTSGIPAEISARQKQYEYYRDKLLSFKEEQ